MSNKNQVEEKSNVLSEEMLEQVSGGGNVDVAPTSPSYDSSQQGKAFK